jgi:myo-inositol-1(or 4)-monophosphatase
MGGGAGGSLVAQAEALARGAAAVVEGFYGKLRRADATAKGARRDLVSDADLASQKYLLERIPAADDVLSEEGSSRSTGAARTWVVDPLDGTINFLHGLPNWCVSIGVVEGGALAAAAVVAPELRQVYTAAAGEGAFCNGERIHVSGTADIGDSILATGLAYRRNELPDHNLDNITTLGFACADLRRMGAAAIDLCYVASGRIDGFWELHLNAWDVAAGALLVREAGGRVTDFRGSERLDDVLHGRHVLASNGAVHEQIRSRLAPLRGL